MRDPNFITLVENYIVFCNFCLELAGAEPLRDIECSVSGAAPNVRTKSANGAVWPPRGRMLPQVKPF